MMIRINPLFFAVLFFVFKMGLLPSFLFVFLTAVLHECGHLMCAMLCFGFRIRRFVVQPWGMSLSIDGKFKKPSDELWVALSGPFVNVLLLCAGVLLENSDMILPNIFMLIINLIPVYPLDGGRAVFALLKGEMDCRTAYTIVRTLSYVSAAVLLVAGVILLFKTELNFSVLLAAVFILFTLDCAGEEEPALRLPQKTVHYFVRSADSVREILKIRSKNRVVILDVFDENHVYVSSLSARFVLECIAKDGYDLKFAEILQKHIALLQKM